MEPSEPLGEPLDDPDVSTLPVADELVVSDAASAWVLPDVTAVPDVVDVLPAADSDSVAPESSRQATKNSKQHAGRRRLRDTTIGYIIVMFTDWK